MSAAIVAGVGFDVNAQETEAESEPRPWAVAMSAQMDETDSQHIYTSLNWGLSDDTWLFISAGRSVSPADRADVTTTDLIAGIDHSFGSIGASFEVESWGEQHVVESLDYRGSVYVHGERYAVGLERERRSIDLTFTVGGLRDRPVNRTVDLTGDGTGIFFRADLTERWRIYGGATNYDYSRPLAVLPRLDVINFLSSSTLTLANSFLEDDRRLGFEWQIRDKLINLSFSRNRSAVDRSEFESVNASILFPITYRMDLEFNLGSSHSDLFRSGMFGGVMLMIYGGG